MSFFWKLRSMAIEMELHHWYGDYVEALIKTSGADVSQGYDIGAIL